MIFLVCVCEKHFDFFDRSPSSSFCTVFNIFSFNIDEVLLINPFVNVFVSGNFHFHNKDLLTYSGGTDRPGELCSLKHLTQIVIFPP